MSDIIKANTAQSQVLQPQNQQQGQNGIMGFLSMLSPVAAAAGFPELGMAVGAANMLGGHGSPSSIAGLLGGSQQGQNGGQQSGGGSMGGIAQMLAQLLGTSMPFASQQSNPFQGGQFSNLSNI